MLQKLKKLASQAQTLKSQAYIYDNMYNHIFPIVEKLDGDIIEIGAFLGKTTVFISKYLEWRKIDKHVYTIDPHSKDSLWITGCQYQHAEEVFHAFINNTIDLKNHTHYVMNSTDASDYIHDNSMCFIFVDGDHSERGVASDINLYCDKLVVNGIICFDDYKNARWRGVGKALKENMANKDDFILLSQGKKEVYYQRVK